MKKLCVKDRYLCWETGEPFFYLGDTAWELFHKLSREEIEYYCKERSRQGFNVMQAVALAEYEGLTVPNYYGKLPLCFENDLPDPAQPDLSGDYSYWDHVDFAVETAAKYQMFVALLPTWGDKYNQLWGVGPVVFTPENAYTYGKWIGNRYKDHWNIIWMLGGDRPLDTPEHRQIIDEMARGILEVDPNHLITFHPMGPRRSTEYVADAPYIDFHTSQSSHGVVYAYASHDIIRQMYEESPKPCMDSEPRYEDHPVYLTDELHYFWSADDVRKNAYWNVLAGGCGHTYGNHCIWFMNRKPGDVFKFHWKDALLHPCAEQMIHLAKLRNSRDYFSLHMDMSLLVDSYTGMGKLMAAKGDNYAFIYDPLGVPFTVDLSKFENTGILRCSWFNPRTGEESVFTFLPPMGTSLFAPPAQGTDWVLILDALS